MFLKFLIYLADSCHAAWESFRDFIPENERGCFIDAYSKRLNSDDLETQVSYYLFFFTDFISKNCVGLVSTTTTTLIFTFVYENHDHLSDLDTWACTSFKICWESSACPSITLIVGPYNRNNECITLIIS